MYRARTASVAGVQRKLSAEPLLAAGNLALKQLLVAEQLLVAVAGAVGVPLPLPRLVPHRASRRKLFNKSRGNEIWPNMSDFPLPCPYDPPYVPTVLPAVASKDYLLPAYSRNLFPPDSSSSRPWSLTPNPDP